MVDLSAPSCAFVTSILADGLHGRYELAAGGEARLRSELTFEEEGRFRTQGTISFGPGHEVRFRTLGDPQLAQSPDPHLKQASVIGEVLGGEGQFEGAYGNIVSHIFVSDSGEITDNHLGVIFVEEQP